MKFYGKKKNILNFRVKDSSENNEILILCYELFSGARETNVLGSEIKIIQKIISTNMVLSASTFKTKYMYTNLSSLFSFVARNHRNVFTHKVFDLVTKFVYRSVKTIYTLKSVKTLRSGHFMRQNNFNKPFGRTTQSQM